MIANLITTILLALGVATGNVSSNSYKGGNAFKHLEEKPIQKATTQVAIEEDNFYQAQYFNGSQVLDSYKYYIGNQNTPNYSNNFINIRNSIYVTHYRVNYQMFTMLTVFLAITPMMNTLNNNAVLSMEVTIDTPANQTGVTQYKSYETTNVIEDYIDITITDDFTANVTNRVWTTNGFPESNNQDIAASVINTGPTTRYDDDVRYNLNSVNQNTTKYIVMACFYAQNYGYEFNMWMSTFDYTCDAINPEINYEVVDIPNLMYTILTLPFSFFSTAFNLTIFPGTPYAVNFGNVILTIIAALTLLYIIKKVLK